LVDVHAAPGVPGMALRIGGERCNRKS
jgi:hypothetical protein